MATRLSFHILGLFPDLLETYFSESLIGKARTAGLLEFQYHQLRDYAQGKHNRVDEKPYGGGAGMVMLPEVVTTAVRDLRAKHGVKRVVLTSPRGQKLSPQLARELASQESVLFVCGRYEGVDERAIQAVVDQEISIGDYVLSGGELAAGVIIDAVSRYVPGVVGKEESVERDSFEDGLLEYPHYTRPEVFEDAGVPHVLLSGHHGEIAAWRRRQSLQITWERRPDLLKKAELTEAEREFLKTLIHSKS